MADTVLRGHFHITRTRMAVLLLVVISIGYFFVINQKILLSLPYPAHVDESHRLEPALHILQTGDLNPHYFHKPSLPIYITAAGLAAGFMNEARKGSIRETKEIGSVSYPFYSHPEIVLIAKQIFALSSALAILFAGLAAYKAYHFRLLLFMPALLIPFSEIYVRSSYLYINVNILGAFFIGVLLYYLAVTLRNKGVAAKAVIPGILCGLVISAKYNLLPIYLPCLGSILFYEKNKFFSRAVVLVVVSVLTVVVLNPYFLLDLPTFLSHTAFQVNHYMVRGHRGFEGTPGAPQFIYYMQSIIDQFGVSAFLFSLVGIVYSVRINWKVGVIFLSFPLGMLLLMSASKVNFLRNLTAVYLLWPIFVVMGMLYGHKLLAGFLRRIDYFNTRSVQAGYLSMALVGLLLVVTLPFNSLAVNMTVQGDSRSAVVQWIKKHVDPGATVILPDVLGMDTRPLRTAYKVVSLRATDINSSLLKSKFFKKNCYILLPSYGFEERWPPTGKQLRAIEQLRNGSSRLIGSGRTELIGVFGANDILLNYFKPLRSGNPRITLLRSASQPTSGAGPGRPAAAATTE
ncbi:MAG: hypothetical protein L3J03_07910 [Desulfobacterales bacterium]|nr:hypothetical protein [Desulfobacterales bacterium]